MEKTIFMFYWPCISTHPCNEDQLDTLFIHSLFRQSASTCLAPICCPSSGGILYIYTTTRRMRLKCDGTGQRPDFVLRRNGRVHLNRRGRQFSRLLAAQGVRISGSNAGYTMFRGSVKSTGYLLHPPISPSVPLPCVTVCHHISAGPTNCYIYIVYLLTMSYRYARNM